MKNSIFIIFKKELARFFGDKRMAFTTLLLPGLMIYIMYSIMGNAISNQFSVDEDTRPVAYVVNLPESVEPILSEAFHLMPTEESSAEEIKEQIRNKETDLLAVFPADFDAAVASYDSASGLQAPNIELFYNTSQTSSQTAYSYMIEMLSNYESVLANRFDVNSGDAVYDLASEKDTTGTIFSSMLPMLLMVFLFTGCMAVAPESIAGEKERGTIATMLVTPMKRSHLAIGKISALALIALLSGISSALGTILSLPKLMGAATDQLNANFYQVNDYLMLGVVILSTVLLLITLISIISAFAKTIKEAQTYIMPLMIVVMVIAVTAMFSGGAKTDFVYYLIPMYNSVQCMIGIFSFEVLPMQIVAAVVSNIVYTGLGVFVLTRMFNNERIVYSK